MPCKRPLYLLSIHFHLFPNSIDNAVMTLYEPILKTDQTDLMFVLVFSRVARFHDQLQDRDAYQGCRRPCSQVSSPTRAIVSKMHPRITIRRSVRRSIPPLYLAINENRVRWHIVGHIHRDEATL